MGDNRSLCRQYLLRKQWANLRQLFRQIGDVRQSAELLAECIKDAGVDAEEVVAEMRANMEARG
jgi:hypothetical protein